MFSVIVLSREDKLQSHVLVVWHRLVEVALFLPLLDLGLIHILSVIGPEDRRSGEDGLGLVASVGNTTSIATECDDESVVERSCGHELNGRS